MFQSLQVASPEAGRQKLSEAAGLNRREVGMTEWGHAAPVYGVLHEDEQRREEWKFLVEGVEDYSDGFDMALSDDSWSGRLAPHEWRRPSWRRRAMEVVLENQQRHAIRSQHNPSILTRLAGPRRRDVLHESTTSSPDIVAFTTWAAPMVRRVWPLLYFQDLVPVIPMTQPTGKIHFLDFVFATSWDTYSIGTRIDNNEDPDFSNSTGECAAVHEIDLQVTEDNITTVTKKLLSKYSLEAEQDGNAYYNLSVGGELARHQAMLIAREWNRMVIEDLRTLGTGGSATFDKTVPAVAPWTALSPTEYKKQIWVPILDVDSLIFGKVYLKSSALVMDEVACNYMEEAEGFSLDPIGDMRGRTSASTTPNLFGTFRNRWDAYVDPFLVPNQIIVIARGPTWLENGYAYFPYIPFFALPLFIDPDTQCVSRGAMERSGRKMFKSDYYGRVNLIAT